MFELTAAGEIAREFLRLRNDDSVAGLRTCKDLFENMVPPDKKRGKSWKEEYKELLNSKFDYTRPTHVVIVSKKALMTVNRLKEVVESDMDEEFAKTHRDLLGTSTKANINAITESRIKFKKDIIVNAVGGYDEQNIVRNWLNKLCVPTNFQKTDKGMQLTTVARDALRDDLLETQAKIVNSPDLAEAKAIIAKRAEAVAMWRAGQELLKKEKSVDR